MVEHQNPSTTTVDDEDCQAAYVSYESINGNGERRTRSITNNNGSTTMVEGTTTNNKSNNKEVILGRNLSHLEDSSRNTRHSVPHPDIEVDYKNQWNQLNTKIQKVVAEKFKKQKDVMDNMEMILPCIRWLRQYDFKKLLLQDVIAGLTVGIMLVPQGMSYAKLAGLPVQYGLYSGLMPVFAYAIWGSSRQLAVGPVALVSLLLSTSLTSIIDPYVVSENGDRVLDENLQSQYNILAIQTAFLVGIVYIGMGLLQLGFITVFLSHAVISGFTSAAAIIIGLSQIKYFFGYDVKRSKVLHEMIQYLFEDIDQINWKTMVMGCGSLFLLLLMKHIGKEYPQYKFIRALGPLTATTISILITWIFGLNESKGIPIVDYIPKGLPSITVTSWTPLTYGSDLVMPVITIAIVGFMESIAIAKQLASKHKYHINSSQELLGLGMSNFIGAAFGSYPVTGSFSRSAVNHDSGAVSGISGLFTAILIALVLLLLTPVFELMPLATLASIVVSGVLGLLDYDEAFYLWRAHKLDFVIWTISFLGTLFLGVVAGLGIAVVISVLRVIYESAYPHTAQLGRLKGTKVYRNIKQYPDAIKFDGVVIVRIDAPIYFANTQHVREKMEKYILQSDTTVGADSIQTKFLVVDCSPVSHIDSSGTHMLLDAYREFKDRGIQMCFVNPNVNVMTRLSYSGLAQIIGRDHFFVTMHDAVETLIGELFSDEEKASYDNFLHEDRRNLTETKTQQVLPETSS